MKGEKQLLNTIQKRIMTESTYFGIPTLKNPLDLWIYQEIIHKTKPDYIVEIGTHYGGGSLALAHIAKNSHNGRVITVDVKSKVTSKKVVDDPYITLVFGDAIHTFPLVRSLIPETATAMIIEDSSHTKDNTLRILRTYSPLVKKGHYFIVEDTICHHGLDEGPFPGPYEAVEEFLSGNSDFVRDRGCEGFGATWNPGGYLLRIS